MSLFKKTIAASLLAASASTFAAPVPVLNFPTPSFPYAVQYGDFASYSMPILDWASTSSGGPAFSFNTANTIQDALVVGTGSAHTNNQDLGLTGATPNGFDFPNIANQNVTQDWSTTTAEANRTSWNISISALQDYLTIGGIQHDLVAYFNNNQTRTNPNLWAWAQVTLVGANNTMDFFFRDTNSSGPTAFNHDDYVFSGHEVELCFSSATQTVANLIDCNVADQTLIKSRKTFVHNLGQNDVGYAIYSQQLSQLIWSNQFTEMRIRVDFAGLNNGYENLFLGAACVKGSQQCRSTDVPEPGIISLLALSMLGLAGFSRRNTVSRKA